MKRFITNLKLKYNNITSKFKRRKIKTSIISLFFFLLALLTMKSYIVFAICSFLSIIIGLKSIRKKQILGLIIIILTIILIAINIINTKKTEKTTDPYDSNVLIGSWIYNDSGGTYNFEKNLTYTQYVTNNLEDNFCYGTYKYEYGYETDKGKMLRKDVDFIYYFLILKPKKCIINGNQDTSSESKKEKNMVFAYGYNKGTKSVIINTTTDLYNTLTKKEEK